MLVSSDISGVCDIITTEYISEVWVLAILQSLSSVGQGFSLSGRVLSMREALDVIPSCKLTFTQVPFQNLQECETSSQEQELFLQQPCEAQKHLILSALFSLRNDSKWRTKAHDLRALGRRHRVQASKAELV